MSRPPGEAKGLGKAIQRARLGQSWSQTELAAKAGVSRPTVARVEAGDDVSTATLEKVAAALGLAIELREE